MRRSLALFLLLCTVLAVAGVVVIQRLDQDRRYRDLLAEGDRAAASGHTYAAIEAYSGALAIRPDSMVAHYRRGEAYLAERQEAQAARDLREARRLAPDAPEPLESLGRLHDGRGEYAIAADWYAQASERLRDADARLLYSLALARYRAGALPAARDAARLAVERDDSLAEAHYLLGVISRDLQQSREAIASLEHAVRLRPSLVAARQELASLYREERRLDEELGQLRSLVTLEGGRITRPVALAMAYLRAGRHDDALAALALAEASVPADSRVALAMGRVHLARAEATQEPAAVGAALAVLERALGGTAPRSEGLALYGRALHLSGDLAGAERLLQDAARTSPVAPEAFGFLADTAEALDHPAIARDALLSLDALQGDTVSRTARAARARRIGSLSLDANDVETALEHLTFAAQAASADAATLGLLARAEWAAGREDAARRTLETARGLAPDDAELAGLARTIR